MQATFAVPRRVSALAGLALAILMVPTAAYARNATPKPVTITYWAGHSSGALHTAVEDEVAWFNRTHHDIHVIFHAIGASHHGLAAFEAGTAPNVGMVSGYIVPQLAQAGAIVNLGPWIHGKAGLSSAAIRNRYYPVVWNDMRQPNGIQYLMPLEKKSLLVLYYNASLFKRAHIAQPPHTWSQVGLDAAKLRRLGSRYHGIAWTPSLAQFFDMTLANGGTIFKPGSHRRAFALNNPGAVRALTMLRSWVRSGTLILTSGYQYQLDFGTGKVGMLIDASAGYTYDKGSVGGKFPMGGVSAPTGTSGHSAQYINGASLVLFNTGTIAQKRASWTFIKWLSSPAVNVFWDTHTNYLPLGPAAYHLMQGFYAKHPAQAASFSPPRYWWYKPRTANYKAAETNMASPFEKALAGQLSVVAALKQMTQVGTAYLSGKVRG